MSKNDENTQTEQTAHTLNLIINGEKYTWTKQYITGAEIRKLAGISPDDQIFLNIKEPWEDEVVNDETNVDLARPGIEHFFSKEKPFKVIIVVNTREREWNKKTISFEELVELAHGHENTNGKFTYTISYSNGPAENKQGTLTEGKSVYVQNKMKFNVRRTLES